MSTVPFSWSVPFNWPPTTRNSGLPGPTGSLHAAAMNAAVTSPASPTIVFRFSIKAPSALQRSDIEGTAHSTGQTGGRSLQRVAVPNLIDAQVRERGHAVHRSHGRGAGQ